MTLATPQARLDVDTLRTLVDTEGPWASVYVGLSDSDARGEPMQRSFRWHRLATDLVELGFPSEVVAALRDLVRSEPPGPATLALFATTAGAVTSFRVAGELEPDAALVGPLPHVVPLLGWLQHHPAHVLVVIDRAGADIDVVVRGRRRRWTVTGPDDEIERNAPGGWAQGRYQRRAEDSWAHNSARVAAEATQALRRTGARLLLVAGDVRAEQLLTDHLPAGIRKTVVVEHLGGGRAPDGSQATLPERVDHAVQHFSDQRLAALLARLDAERAPSGRTVEGVRATVEALRRGDVQSLLIVPTSMAGRTAWFGPAGDVRLEPATALTVPGMARGPLVDVVVRAALATRADVWVLPPGQPQGPYQGLGGLRRFH